MELLQFESLLPNTNADVLKRIAVAWDVPRGVTRKDHTIIYLMQAINEPEILNKMLQTLSIFEIAMLQQLVRNIDHGNPITGDSLVQSILWMGFELPKDKSRDNPISDYLTNLFKKGVIGMHGADRLDNTYSWHTSYRVSIDVRMKKAVEKLPIVAASPLTLDTVATPDQTCYRRSQSIMLQHLAFMRAFHEIGELKINKSGERAISNSASIKLLKKLNWNNVEDNLWDSLVFPYPGDAYMKAVRRSGWADELDDVGVLVPRLSLAEFAAQSPAKLTRDIMLGLLSNAEWLETRNFGYMSQTHLKGRTLLFNILRTLPATRSFFQFDSFLQAIYKRIHRIFNLGNPPRSPEYDYEFRNMQPAKKQQIFEDWQNTAQQKWLTDNREFVENCLKTWGHGFGVVELGLTDGKLTCFRLTDFGRAVLEQIDETSAESEVAANNAWLVQPNFDMLVYLDHASSGQLAFVERVAERSNIDRYVAHYRITRETVYQAFEADITAESMLTQLKAGSNTPLPNNIVREIEGWAALRQQITLRPFASIMAFENSTDRDLALSKKLDGQAIGECFARITNSSAAKSYINKFDYALALPSCLQVEEDGEINIVGAPDMLIEAQLAKWAERLGPGNWQFTQNSIKNALKNKQTYAQLSVFLHTRLKSKLPRFTEVLLKAWAGEASAVDLEKDAIVFRCANEDMLKAIVGSAKFKSMFRCTIAPTVALVKPKRLADLKAALLWAGLDAVTIVD